MAKGDLVDAKQAAKLVIRNWWLYDKFRPTGAALQASGDGVWIGDGWTAWRITGADAKWIDLLLQADAAEHRAKGLAQPDFNQLRETSLVDAVDWQPTNLMLRISGNQVVRMFVGPRHEVKFVATAHLEPLLDVMKMRWRAATRETAGLVGGILTDDLCILAPVKVDGDNRPLARAWREWTAEDMDGDDSDEDDTALGKQEELLEALMPWASPLKLVPLG